MHAELSSFHPIIAQWFEQLGQPTDIQIKAWPKITCGSHCLISAPTGSGKTLTAFLWALNRFITGDLATGHTRILYVSPLKALNNDIQHNLNQPLGELKQLFAEKKVYFPTLKVQTRSGDTDTAERRQMIRQPPEILITTPESLNLLLSSKSGLSLLANLDTVILDEVHALIDNKRGAYLFSAVERLVALSGEFQRIALSATVKPLDNIAAYIAGFRLNTDKADYATNPHYLRRDIAIVESKQQKTYQVDIRYPETIANRAADKKLWDAMAEELFERIQANHSTLIFVNNRALCEKLTHKINHVARHIIAYAHHGSLSREIRQEVEQKLKAGKLSAIIATSSLEMGIDIGALDEVLLIQTAGSMSSAIQRIGRAGHRVGEVSKGVLYPTHAQDLLEAVVLAKAVLTKDIEPSRPIHCPLDVLAQVIISMVGTAIWDLDQLYAQLRASSVYHTLSHSQFDLVINMLAGRYADQRIRELKPKISVDRLDNTVQARKGALLSLYMSGGVIPNRGYFQLRHIENSARIGELDEEFVWEAKVGQVFTLGTQFWQIEKITHNDVFVRPGKPGPTPPPFWKAESISRNFYFSEQIGVFLEMANEALQNNTLIEKLKQDFSISPKAALALSDFLRQQQQHSGCELPHRHHLLIESVDSLLGYDQANQIVLHTGWGAEVNRPWAMAMEAAWYNQYAEQLEIYTSNESLVLQLPHDIAVESLLSLVSTNQLDQLLRQRLEGSGFFGARFRECAGRALLINKGHFNKRQPLWVSRLRSQKLLDTVLKYEDFPILLETWRDCLQDEFDLKHLRQLLDELNRGEIRWSVTHSKTPSPMAANIAWEQINQYMYMDDSPTSNKVSNLRNDLLKDLVFNAELRPQINAQQCYAFEQKRQRLLPGYLPDTGTDLLDWVKERIAIPMVEWHRLLECMAADISAENTDKIVVEVQFKLARIIGPTLELVVAQEQLPGLINSFYKQNSSYKILTYKGKKEILLEDIPTQKPNVLNTEELTSILLTNWLQFYAPKTISQIETILGIAPDLLITILNDLVQSRILITGNFLENDEHVYFCDSDNFEILLYLAKQVAQPSFTPLALKKLPLFLATWQHLNDSFNNNINNNVNNNINNSTKKESLDITEQLFQTVQQQICHFSPVELWEKELLPARIANYDTKQLDHIIQESELHWVGLKKERIGFCFNSDLDLICEEKKSNNDELKRLFPDSLSRYELQNLQQKANLSNSKLVPMLWQWVWTGSISNDTFAAVRKGIDAKFQYPGAEQLSSKIKTNTGRRSLKRAAFSHWKQISPFIGAWYRIDYPEIDNGFIETEERNKDRVRILLERYGILFRELLLNEHPLFQWRNIFRSLRLMELSREIVSGYFFKDIPGPQFISHRGLRALQKELPEEYIYWLNAKDPLSFCGSQIKGLKDLLPKRIESNHIVYRGSEIVVISERNGKQLTFTIAPTDSRLQEYLVSLRHLLFRAYKPLKNIQIETINGQEAKLSDYLEALKIAFDLTCDYKSVTLYKKSS